jgi:Tfp pilus assembly protein PilP
MNGETMPQLTLDFPQHKNGNASQGRPRERNLADDLKQWLADLDAAEALRREQLHQIAELRSHVYRHAKARGLTPMMLHAARSLMRK